jgi:hypothetical protein
MAMRLSALRAGRPLPPDAATCTRSFLARGFFYPEDVGDTFLRNVGSHKSTRPHIPEDGFLHWKPQTLQPIICRYEVWASEECC